MKKNSVFALLLALALLLVSCGGSPEGDSSRETSDVSHGDVSDTSHLEGIFEGEGEVHVTCVSGTAGAWTQTEEGLCFSGLAEDSVYRLSGTLRGGITVEAGEFALEIELAGLSVCAENSPAVTVLSGNRVTLTAKGGTENYLYDLRPSLSEEEKAEEAATASAVFSAVDLTLGGRGALTVLSEGNNGIHSKKDITVKKLTLFVRCRDNALKGNDSVTLESGQATLIATAGDGIKTKDSALSEKGNQRGTVSVLGGEHTVYAARDGIDAAYDFHLADGAALTVYTDSYSAYSETSKSEAVEEDIRYIRIPSQAFSFAVRYQNSEEDSVFLVAEYHSTVSGRFADYLFYSYPALEGYEKYAVYLYESGTEITEETEPLAVTDLLTVNEAYDTFVLTPRGYQLSYSFANYADDPEGGMGGPGMGGPGTGGMGEGNAEKVSYSAKGIKAQNAICIEGGTLTVLSYDDALHAGGSVALENGEMPEGSILVLGGDVTLTSKDDGIHADGALTLSGGRVSILESYEGLEGTAVSVSGGDVSVMARDDGINSTLTEGVGVSLTGGAVFVYAGGDGIDANSRTSYEGIVFDGADVAVISTSGGNSAIDTERGYTYLSGRVLAWMPSGGMMSESQNCQSFASVASTGSVRGDGLSVTVSGKTAVTVGIPATLSGAVIYLGSPSAAITAVAAPEGAVWN